MSPLRSCFLLFVVTVCLPSQLCLFTLAFCVRQKYWVGKVLEGKSIGMGKYWNKNKKNRFLCQKKSTGIENIYSSTLIPRTWDRVMVNIPSFKKNCNFWQFLDFRWNLRGLGWQIFFVNFWSPNPIKQLPERSEDVGTELWLNTSSFKKIAIFGNFWILDAS